MAKDSFYPQVKTALMKEGWIITHDPAQIGNWGVKLEVDFGAERLLKGS